MSDAVIPAVDTAPPADGHRIKQLNSLVQQEVSGLLIRQFEWPTGVLVTVSKVKVADDATSAKVWLSVLPETKAEEILKMVNANIRVLQKELNQKLVMKFVPKLIFTVDTTESTAERVHAILDRIQHEQI